MIPNEYKVIDAKDLKKGMIIYMPVGPDQPMNKYEIVDQIHTENKNILEFIAIHIINEFNKKHTTLKFNINVNHNILIKHLRYW